MGRKKPNDDEFDEFEDFEEEETEAGESPEPDEERPARTRPPEVEILFEDDHVLVINKPAGLDSTRGQFAEISVLDVLEAKLKGLSAPLRLVHRLDRETSGLMLLAKTEAAQRDLSGQWETRTVDKTYLVIVHGVVTATEGTIDLPLRKTQLQSRPVVIDHQGGKPAVTEYKVREQYRQYALVEAHPVTGRMHQIRVHFAAEGTPVLCDKRYGTPEPLLLSKFKRRYKPSGRKKERPLIDRLALHANRLEFTHPTTGERRVFELDPPKDFAAAVKQLGKYGR